MTYAWTPPVDFAHDEVLDATDLNNLIVNNLGYLAQELQIGRAHV